MTRSSALDVSSHSLAAPTEQFRIPTMGASSRHSIQSRHIHSWVPSVNSKRATCLIPLDPANPFATRLPAGQASAETPPETSKKMSVLQASVRDSQATFVGQSNFDYSNRGSMAGGTVSARIRLTTHEGTDAYNFNLSLIHI